MGNVVTVVDETTNATKGILAAGLVLVVQGVEVFGVYDFDESQSLWINSVIAFAGLLWISVTKSRSKKRIPEA